MYSSRVQLTRQGPRAETSCTPSILPKAAVLLIYYLLDSTNTAMSLYKIVTFLVDVDVPLPLQSSQGSVNEQLSEFGVLQRCTKGRKRDGRRGGER